MATRSALPSRSSSAVPSKAAQTAFSPVLVDRMPACCTLTPLDRRFSTLSSCRTRRGTLSAAPDASHMTPIAGAGHTAPAYREAVVSFGLATGGAALLLACVLLLRGLHHRAADRVPHEGAWHTSRTRRPRARTLPGERDATAVTGWASMPVSDQRLAHAHAVSLGFSRGRGRIGTGLHGMCFASADNAPRVSWLELWKTQAW